MADRSFGGAFAEWRRAVASHQRVFPMGTTIRANICRFLIGGPVDDRMGVDGLSPDARLQRFGHE